MQSHPPAMFIADSLGLDFINSIATPVDTPVDWIADGDGLLRWLAQAQLVPPVVLDELKARATPGALDNAAGRNIAAADWGSDGQGRLRGKLLRHQGVRGPGVHADVCRPHAGAGAPMVQHGDLRQPRQAGRAPQPDEGQGLRSAKTTAPKGNGT